MYLIGGLEATFTTTSATAGLARQHDGDDQADNENSYDDPDEPRPVQATGVPRWVVRVLGRCFLREVRYGARKRISKWHGA